MMLRAMTERLGDVGYPFSRSMPRQAEIYAKELREVRNKWAHTGEFTAPEAYRAIDSAELLLRSIDAPNRPRPWPSSRPRSHRSAPARRPTPRRR